MLCLICSHPDHDALLAALPTTSLRQLERTYGVSRSVLSRHRQRGCPAPRVTRVTRVTGRSGGELERVIMLLEEIRDLLAAAVHQRHVEDDYTGTVAPHVTWNRL